MVALALLVVGVVLICVSARGLDDGPRESSVGTSDALLFLLCLAGVLAARRKRDEDDDL